MEYEHKVISAFFAEVRLYFIEVQGHLTYLLVKSTQIVRFLQVMYFIMRVVNGSECYEKKENLDTVLLSALTNLLFFFLSLFLSLSLLLPPDILS